MTKKQREQFWAKKRRERLRERRAAKKQREQKWKDARRQRRAVKAAPRLALNNWSRKVRACGKCQVCDCGGILHAHHLLPKERYPEFKLRRKNGVCLCPNHHKFGKYSAHRNPIWFVLWLRKHLPEQYEWAKKRMGEDATVMVGVERKADGNEIER